MCTTEKVFCPYENATCIVFLGLEIMNIVSRHRVLLVKVIQVKIISCPRKKKKKGGGGEKKKKKYKKKIKKATNLKNSDCFLHPQVLGQPGLTWGWEEHTVTSTLQFICSCQLLLLAECAKSELWRLYFSKKYNIRAETCQFRD